MKINVVIVFGLLYLHFSEAQNPRNNDPLEALDHNELESFDFENTTIESLTEEIMRLHNLRNFTFDDDLKKTLLEGVLIRKRSEKFDSDQMTIDEATDEVRRLDDEESLSWRKELKRVALKDFVLKKMTEYFLIDNDLYESDAGEDFSGDETDDEYLVPNNERSPKGSF